MPVPEAEPAVGALRLAHDPSAAVGVPAHITILFPFLPDDQVEEPALRELFERFPAFDFTLDRFERFETGLTWLHANPAWRFADLTAAVWQRWPDHAPYEGIHDEVIPHLTVSADAIELDLPLPIACCAREIVLIEEAETDGMWTARLRFALG